METIKLVSIQHLISCVFLMVALFEQPSFAADEGDTEAAQSEFEMQSIQIDVDGEIEDIPYQISDDGDAILEGDMIIGRAKELRGIQGPANELMSISNMELFGLFTRGRRLWPRGIVKYRISSRLEGAARVIDAINHWRDVTRIQFVEAGDRESRFVEFIPTRAGYCSSQVGYQARRQVIRVSRRCSWGTIAHEIGHTVGLGHEHMRSDQSTFVTVNYDNVIRGMENNFTPKPRFYFDDGPYCYGSIMHYGRRKYARNKNRDTITPKKSKAKIGQRNGLSGCDIHIVNNRYAAEISKR